MAEAVKPLTVWVLSDGRPGHYNQSKGIVKALELLRPVELQWIEVDLRAGFFRRVLKELLNHTTCSLPEWLLRLCFRLPDMPANRPEIIVSAGGKTSYLNAALARRFDCQNVFAGSLRGLSDRFFSAVLTLEPIPGAQRNIVVDLAPTIVDPEEVRVAGTGYRREKGLDDSPLWAMILGGDGAGYVYEKEDWVNLAAVMTELATKYRIKWLLTTSRRTGRKAESVLQEMLPAEILVDSVWYGNEPRKVMQAFLGASEVVFCSEDSMSMITEAIASARPVYSFRPSRANPDLKYRKALECFVGHGWLSRITMSKIGGDQVDLASCKLTPLSLSPSKTLSFQLNKALMLS